MIGMWLAHFSPWNSSDVTLQSLSIMVYLSVITNKDKQMVNYFMCLQKLTQITWTKQIYFYYYYISQIKGKAGEMA